MTLFALVQKVSAGFQGFWVRWPRKVAKLEAQKAWNQVVTPDDEDAIQSALDWQVPIFQQREPEHIPHAATWIRGRRWEDEKPAPKKVTVSPAIGRRLDDHMKQQNINAQIQFLVSRGMSLEDAKRKVYLEQGWIKEEPS